jgi:hypothetical protein
MFYILNVTTYIFNNTNKILQKTISTSRLVFHKSEAGWVVRMGRSMQYSDIVSRLPHRKSDNFVNLTDLCKVLGKQFKNYCCLQRCANAIRQAGERRPGVPIFQLGGKAGGGTPSWACDEIVVDVLRWSKHSIEELDLLIPQPPPQPPPDPDVPLEQATAPQHRITVKVPHKLQIEEERKSMRPGMFERQMMRLIQRKYPDWDDELCSWKKAGKDTKWKSVHIELTGGKVPFKLVPYEDGNYGCTACYQFEELPEPILEHDPEPPKYLEVNWNNLNVVKKILG